MYSSKIIAIIIAIALSFSVFGQKAPIKFGKIDKDDLKMEYYEKDSGAPAVVLCDFGRTFFVYNEEKGFQMKFSRVKRIKILKKEGYDYANFEIPTYKKSFNEEEVSGIKAITFNYEKGKVVKDKLSRKDIYKVENSKYWSSTKFTLPNVKKGSVIDIQYTLTSDFLFNLQDWYFQEEIPVKWSEYRVTIPEFFYYKLQHKGYEQLDIADNYRKSEEFTYRYSSQISDMTKPGGGGRTSGGIANFESYSHHYRFAASNIKAFIEEPYLTTSENYITKVEFELESVKFPNTPLKNYTQTWQHINDELIDYEEFGHRLKRDRFIESKVNELTQIGNNDVNGIISIYYYMLNNFKWNGARGLYANENLKKVFEQKSGNVAEINLLLTLMLRAAGYDANPVILSTRDHGIIRPGRPMLSAFNYVVVHVNHDKGQFILDATDHNCPFNTLPARCLNGKGRLISKTTTQWVDLTPQVNSATTYMAELAMDENLQIKGTIDVSSEGYAGINKRNKIQSFTNIDQFIDDRSKTYSHLSLKDYEIDNLDAIDKSLAEHIEVEIADHINTAGDLAFFNPIFIDNLEKNPFKLEERVYPVDYAYPIHKSYVLNLKLPENYTIEEIPKPMKIALPENAGYYFYNITSLNDDIQFVSKFIINKTLFVQYEYKNLKEFYNQVVNKNNEQIVLKKL